MYKKYIYTCYGCSHFYADKSDRYQSKHCEIVDIWKCWEERIWLAKPVIKFM